MAKQVFQSEQISLRDGTEITLKPLNIKGIRKFNAKLREMRSIEPDASLSDEDKASWIEDQTLEKLLDMAAICLSQEPIMADTIADRDALEEVLDLDTMYEILKKVGGLDLVSQNAQILAQLATE